MRARLVLGTVWCVCGFAVVLGADLKLTNGKVYKNYRVDRVTLNGVVIEYATGSVEVPFRLLPQDLRERYQAQRPVSSEAVAENSARVDTGPAAQQQAYTDGYDLGKAFRESLASGGGARSAASEKRRKNVRQEAKDQADMQRLPDALKADFARGYEDGFLGKPKARSSGETDAESAPQDH